MEVWKPIEGTNGKYEVSNCGRVRSLWRKTPFILKPHFLFYGDYLVVCLVINGKRKYFAIHRLVAKAFIPNPDSKPEVNHINGIKTDNRVENLEWVTRSENQRHAYATDLQKTKLTNEQVCYIRDNHDNFSTYELARRFFVNKSTIIDIQLGKSHCDAGGAVREPKFHCHRVPNDIRDQIRAEYKKGIRGCGSTTLAKKYGISATTVLSIIKETVNNKS